MLWTKAGTRASQVLSAQRDDTVADRIRRKFLAKSKKAKNVAEELELEFQRDMQMFKERADR